MHHRMLRLIFFVISGWNVFEKRTWLLPSWRPGVSALVRRVSLEYPTSWIQRLHRKFQVGSHRLLLQQQQQRQQHRSLSVCRNTLLVSRNNYRK